MKTIIKAIAAYCNNFTFSIILIIIFFSNLSCVTNTNKLYRDALQDVKCGNLDFAFIKLNNYLIENPNSVNSPAIKFALIEYYFQTKNYRNAIEKLNEYILEYPEEPNNVFALALLYKILSDSKEDSPLIAKLKEAFFSKSIFLTFSESKSKSYKSLLNNNYRILDFINDIEIYKNDELFFKITP